MNDRNLHCSLCITLALPALIRYIFHHSIGLSGISAVLYHTHRFASSIIIFLYHNNLYIVCNGSQNKISHCLWCMTIVPMPKWKKKINVPFWNSAINEKLHCKPEKSVTRLFRVFFFRDYNKQTNERTTAIYLSFLCSQNSN